MKKLNIKIPIIFSFIALLMSCNDILDKEALTSISGDQLETSSDAMNAYLNSVYYNEMPGMPYGMAQPGGCYKTMYNWWWGGPSGWIKGWNLVNYGTGVATDEAVPEANVTDKYLSGQATFDWLENYSNANVEGNKWGVQAYADIRTCNQIIEDIDRATFDDTNKKRIKGQALFFRAWIYYKLVKDVGGVPLILTAQPTNNDLTQVQQPRNKTSECVAQILADLDAASPLLPVTWTGEDVGKIDQIAANAFEGRVALFFASPLFNGLNGISTWQKAYDANLAAKTLADNNGKGLYNSYKNIWTDRLNKEVIMVRRFHSPDNSYAAVGFAPLNWGGGNDWDVDCPSIELINSFPLKNGSSWNEATMAYDTLFKHRDDRFYASIAYNGAPIQWTPRLAAANTYLWTYVDAVTGHTTDGNNTPIISANRNTVTPITGEWFGETNYFFRLKAVDQTVDLTENSGNDWPEIRYAEVLLNLAEAANETGKPSEALGYLYQIRQRAGILAGTGNFGIIASSQADVRTAIQNERFVEFCFEGKRLDDLRRWKLFGQLRTQKQRHGLLIVKKTGENPPLGMDDINKVWNKFTYTKINGDAAAGISIPDSYYIFGIPYAFLSRNPKLVQNNNWGGAFDPFQ